MLQKYSATIKMPSEEYALIVCRAVSVDPELRPDEVDRSITAHGDVIHINVSSTNVKTLRTAVTSLYDFIRVSMKAVAQFTN